jgi:HK97 family phage portal protein
MNLIKSLTLTKLGQLNPFRSKGSMTPAMRNQLIQALFRMYGNNLPIGMEDNPEQYIKRGYAYNSDTYSIINYILTAAAGVNWVVKRRYKSSRKPEIITDHEIHERWSNPNPLQTNTEWLHSILGYKLTTGNAYAYKIAADAGMKKGIPLELYSLPAHAVEIIGGNIKEVVSGYRIIMGTWDVIPAEKVAHLKYWNPTMSNLSDMYGLSPIRAGAQVVLQSNEAFNANAKAFHNGGAEGFISQKIVANSDTPILDQDQMDIIERAWEKKFTGGDNFKKIGFASTPLEYTKIGLSPVDLALLGAMKLSFQQLCRLWQFPSVLLNDNENSTFNNVAEARKALYNQCVLPLLYDLQEHMIDFLVKPFGDNLILEPDTSTIPELQEDMKEKVAWLKDAFWIKGSRKQELMGEEPDPEMDMYFDPNGLPLLFDRPESSTEEDAEKLVKEGIKDYKKD